MRHRLGAIRSGAELAVEADPRDGAARARHRHRHHRAADPQPALAATRPAIRGGKSAAVPAARSALVWSRRLKATATRCSPIPRRTRWRPRSIRACRTTRGLCRRHSVRQDPVGAGDGAVEGYPHDPGVRRRREGGHVHLRIGRRRLNDASHRRALSPERGLHGDPRAVPRRRLPAGDMAGRVDFAFSPIARRCPTSAPGAFALAVSAASARPRCRTCRPRSRRATRIPITCSGRAARAGGDAARDHQPAA